MKILSMVLPLILFATQSIAETSIVVDDLQTRIIQQIAKHTEISLKVSVINNGEQAEITVRVKAIDINGFELVTASLRGVCNHAEHKILTTTRLIKDDIYTKIDRWEISESYAYPTKQ